MWRLEHIGVLWWWLLIPLMVMGIYWLSKQRNQKFQKLGNPDKVKALLNVVPQQTLIKRIIWLVALGCIILAMANLQSGTEEESVTNKGSNVIIALDLSNSMLAKDVAPDRLARSKKFLTDLVSRFGGDRVALIVFAGRAYIQMPFTTDYGAFEMHLKSVNTDMIPTQGTALGEAIQVAESLQGTDKNQEKVLIILSDGEDHDSKAVNIAKSAGSKHLTIHTIGVGTRSGAPIPEKSRIGVAYKKDPKGNQILSQLNEDVLQDIASAGGGKYFNISDDRKALKEIQRSIKWAAGSTGEEKVYTRYKNYFQWFLFPAIILLMLELASVQILFRNRKNITSILLLIVGTSIFYSCKKKDDLSQAYEKYQKAAVESAISEYQKIYQKDSSEIALFNLGASFLAAQQLDSALNYFEHFSKTSKDSFLLAQAQFNRGNVFYQKQDYKSAADAFVSSLRYQTDNYRTQYNLSLALLHLPPQDQQDQNQEQENDPKDQNNQDQNDSENKDQKDAGNDQDSKDQEQEKKDEEKKDSEEKKNPSDTEKEQQQPQKPQQQKGKLSPQDVQRLFQALDQQEKAVQKRIMTQQGENSSQPYIEKDW